MKILKKGLLPYHEYYIQTCERCFSEMAIDDADLEFGLQVNITYKTKENDGWPQKITLYSKELYQCPVCNTINRIKFNQNSTDRVIIDYTEED